MRYRAGRHCSVSPRRSCRFRFPPRRPRLPNSIAAIFGDRPIAEGPIKLELPPLAETGNSVPLTVICETQALGRVRRLAVFTEMNPRPLVCVASFGPMAAEARITTNIRLASTQAVVCVAELEDGRLISSRQNGSVWSLAPARPCPEGTERCETRESGCPRRQRRETSSKSAR